MAENNSMFRKTALDTVSNPEQLDQHVRVTKPYAWVLLTAIIIFAVGVGIWAFTGDIATNTDITGIISSTEGITAVNTVTTGTVTDNLILNGDYVDKGDIIMVVPDTDLLTQIAQAKASSASSATIDALKYQYIINSFITAPKSGNISSSPDVGSSVTAGQQVAVDYSPEEMNKAKMLIAYVPYTTASNFYAGQEVQVSPSGASRDQYGYITGKISDIGTSIVTSESVAKTLGSEKYYTTLNVEQNSVEVKIILDTDTSSKSGFKYSTEKGKEDVEVNVDEVCSIKVKGKETHPISLLGL